MKRILTLLLLFSVVVVDAMCQQYTKLTIDSFQNFKINATIDSTYYPSPLRLNKSYVNLIKDSLIKVKKNTNSNGLGIGSKDSLNSKFKSKIKQSNITIGGTIANESYASNFVLPFSTNQPVYSRWYGNTKVAAYNIPLNVDFYYTTEPNQYYNSNFITVSLDKDQLIANARNGVYNKIKQKQNEVKLNTISKDLIEKQKRLVLDSINHQKNKLKSIEKPQLPLDIKDTTALKNHIEVLALQKIDEQKSGLQDSIEQINNYKIQINDSIERIYQIYNEKKAQYDSINQKINALESKYNYADSMYHQYIHLDSAYKKEIEKLESFKNDGALLQSIGEKYIPNKIRVPLEKVLGAIDRFQVGLTTPFFSKYILTGVPVKGIDIALKGNKITTQLVYGKMNSFFSPINANGFEDKKASFENPIYGLRLEYKPKENFVLSWNNTLIVSNAGESIETKNTATGLELDWQFNSKLDFKGAIYSTYLSYLFNKPNSPIITEQPLPILTPIQLFKQQSMYVVESKYKLFKNTDVIGKITRVNLGYNAFGAPFNRRNFLEHDVALKQVAFKRKLLLDLGYKNLQMLNLPGDSITNKSKGFSFNLRTNLKKLPNLILNYSPYFQGNNHPDTLFRTNNQYSLFTSTVFYSFKTKLVSHTVSASFTNAKTEFFQLNNRIVQTRLGTGMYIVTIKKLSVAATFQVNRVNPGIDTVNYNSYRLNITQKLNEKYSIGLQTMYNRFQNNSYLYTGGIQFNATFKNNIVLQSIVSGGRIHELYAISDQNTFFGRINVVYPLNYKVRK